MKRIVSLLFVILLLAALPLPAAAAHVSGTEAAEALAALELLNGTGNGFELDRGATRAEAATMLLRLLGKEAAAKREADACPFDDGGWAAPILTYAWKNGLVLGRSASHFGSNEPVGSRDYVTMLLRALGYSDTLGDFSWGESLAFADSIGLCHGEYTAASQFLREDLALLSYTALSLPLKDSDETLAQQLYRSGVISGAAMNTTRLAPAAAADKPVYDGVEIHELGASAVLYVEVYETEEDFRKDESAKHGSGFFITADGVAVLSYHELDGCAYARVTTLDGHRYDVTGVLSYDPLRDTAVVRVSRTDLDGNTVRFFPYLNVGDSDALRTGERVYTLSNPLGLIDNITDGLLSNRSRNLDDPDYLCLQISAPIAAGSSGGALLNCHGEAVGIIFASYRDGENMNLAIPINSIASVPLTGTGTPLLQVKETVDRQKAAATLSVSETELALQYGESAKVLVSHNSPCTAQLRYEISQRGVVTCAWGDFLTKHSVPLTVTAVGDGEADIEITFSDGTGNEDECVVIHVSVTGTPENADEDMPSGTTGN